MCVRASYMKLTRDTHLMQQFVYYYKQLYMFRVSICPSSGVLSCIRIVLLHMVSSTVKENCALVGSYNTLWQPTNTQFSFIVLDTMWSSIIRIQPNTPEDGHIDARNM